MLFSCLYAGLSAWALAHASGCLWPEAVGRKTNDGTPRNVKLNIFDVGGFPSFRAFEKGLADRGGWRKEIPPIP